MFIAKGLLAQKKSIVLLKNDTLKNVPVLPLKPGIKIYIKNINKIYCLTVREYCKQARTRRCSYY